MDELIKAARAEGAVDVPAPESAWSGNAALVQGFEDRYHVNVDVVPVSGDAQQIANPALDVFELSADTVAAHREMFAPYLVFYWSEIPVALKDHDAHWYDSCGGFISAEGSVDIGEVPTLRNTVALDGLPAQSEAALDGVVALSMSLGGSPENLAPALALFDELAAAHKYVVSGADLRIDWNYAFAGPPRSILAKTVASYSVQAINRSAPHPAAARLWEEYLFSDGGQNMCARYRARPSRLDAMRSAGVLDLSAAAMLDPIPGNAVFLTPEQVAGARAYVAANWPSPAGCAAPC